MRSRTSAVVLLAVVWFAANPLRGEGSEEKAAPADTGSDQQRETRTDGPKFLAFDGFDEKLSLDWQIRNVDLAHVSLTKRPGTLTISTQQGDFWESSTNYRNLLLVNNPAPGGGDFQLTTCLVSFAPGAAYQQAGLVCFNDQDDYLKFASEWSIHGGGRKLALIRESRGQVSPRFVYGASKADRLWLRLTKQGNRYVYSSSTDGRLFQKHAELPWGDGAPKFVGLVAFNTTSSNAPETDASFDFFQVCERPVVEKPLDRYAVPTGGVEELLKFIEGIKQFRPQTDQQSAEYEQKGNRALTAAAKRILKLEEDQWSHAYQLALRVLLEDRVRMIETASSAQQRQTLGYVKTFLTAKTEKGLQPADVDLAIATAWALESSGNRRLAAEAYADFARLSAQSGDKLSQMVEMLKGATRRLALLGKPIELEGTRIDGAGFDWSTYRGKLVLVYFWATDSDPCRAELAGVKLHYRLYHERGFDVVGISADPDRRALEEFLMSDLLPWVTLHEEDPAAAGSMVTYYGVTGVPTALLVGKDGKVVSLGARGNELGRLLEQLIGPPYVTKGEFTYVDLRPKANQKLTEDFHGGVGGNHLAELPRGEQTCGGVKFKIAADLIQLGGTNLPNRPEKVEGISVNKRFAKLYILHGTGHAGKAGADGTTIGHYRVRYEDQTVEMIPIVYGEDVRDWWNTDHSRAVPRGKVVWAGSNSSARRFNWSLRLYLAMWENPQPDKKVVSIDYVSTNTTAVPFCVAMTVEEAAGAETDE